jgi:hypothetical protein
MTAGKGSNESPSELRARALLEQDLDCQLERVPEREIPTVDYRTPDGTVGIEVKRITSAEYLQVSSAFAKVRHLDSNLLTGRWCVMIDRPTLSTILAPMPKYPDDDEEQIAYWESQGFVLSRRADREAEWRAAHPGPIRQTPRLNTLTTDLEGHLAVLDAHGITTTRGLAPFGRPKPLASAIAVIFNRTQGALCLRRDPHSNERPGIDVALASGSIRTERADTISERLQLWLDSSKSSNLRESLANEPAGTIRHAVVVFDAQTEPEYPAAMEQGTTFCPSLPLQLPAEIDVVWFILGPIASCFTVKAGWRTVRMPDPLRFHK